MRSFLLILLSAGVVAGAACPSAYRCADDSNCPPSQPFCTQNVCQQQPNDGDTANDDGGDGEDDGEGEGDRGGEGEGEVPGARLLESGFATLRARSGAVNVLVFDEGFERLVTCADVNGVATCVTGVFQP